MPGSTRGRAPVAMMMCFAWYVPGPSAPFGAGAGGPCTDFVAGLTVTLPGASIAASPQITSILFFFMQEADAGREPRRHVARALHDRAGVEADLALDDSP